MHGHPEAPFVYLTQPWKIAHLSLVSLLKFPFMVDFPLLNNQMVQYGMLKDIPKCEWGINMKFHEIPSTRGWLRVEHVPFLGRNGPSSVASGALNRRATLCAASSGDAKLGRSSFFGLLRREIWVKAPIISLHSRVFFWTNLPEGLDWIRESVFRVQAAPSSPLSSIYIFLLFDLTVVLKLCCTVRVCLKVVYYIFPNIAMY